MKCPYCAFTDNHVIDSRLSKDKNVIRRRRECNECGRRFTTYERVEEMLPFVIKKDGRREPFDRMKILAGLRKACQKRPVSANALERLVDRIESKFQEVSEKEIKSTEIGEAIMNELRQVDEVAYIRFASVYRSFKDIDEFLREVKQIQDYREKGKTE
jgi:transcriptional repressor NrdR